MERQYSVTYRGNPVGKVLVSRQGLYCHFSCRCALPGDTMVRLILTCGNVRENLGILIPEGECFHLETQIPGKRIGMGEMSFSLEPKQERVSGTFIPICPEEPFAYLSRLKEAFLENREGQIGIRIRL